MPELPLTMYYAWTLQGKQLTTLLDINN